MNAHYEIYLPDINFEAYFSYSIEVVVYFLYLPLLLGILTCL